MRTLFYSILLLTLPVFSFSKGITKEQAALVARNFYLERASISKSIQPDEISIQGIESVGMESALYFVCRMKPEGFVVVSASDKVIPVLAYSFESSYPDKADLPGGFLTWMKHYEKQIDFAVQNNSTPPQNITSEWQRLLDNEFRNNSDLKYLQSVAPLIVSKWNQDTPYNSWCPPDPAGPGGRCYAGCVATTMGQLLYYYRFPQHGQGSYSYTHPQYGTISANFAAASYEWNGMPSVISKLNNPIGELLFHQGVSVDMDYGPDGSGMWNHKAAYSLKTYFGYGPETQYYFRDSVSIDWDSLLVTNLDQRKPLYYAGWEGVQSTSGHAFVCDGYQPGNYYHFNWGWGGSLDGYFYTDNLCPGGSNFNFAQEVIPLFPDTIQNPYPANCQGITTLTNLRGSIEDGSGWYNYQNNASCSWLIAPQDIEYDSIKNIVLTFLRFDTEQGADTLYVYDGIDAASPLLGAFCGNTVPGTITSSGNRMFLEFHSNASNTKGGWQLDYESKFPVYCTGITTVTSPAGNIDDGSNEKKYSNNSNCRWKIMPAGGMPVTFSFSSFDTFDSTDFVKVYDLQTQELLGTFSGNELPPLLTANSGKMLILFMSNGSGNAQGWSGSYFTSGVGITEKDTCPNPTEVFPNPSNGVFTIEKYFSGRSEHEFNICVLNMKGEKFYDNNFKVIEGLNTFSMNFLNLPDDTYLLNLSGDEQKETIKIIIKK